MPTSGWPSWGPPNQAATSAPRALGDGRGVRRGERRLGEDELGAQRSVLPEAPLPARARGVKCGELIKEGTRLHDVEVARRTREKFTPGRFVANIMHFARVLRAAGLPVGPGKVLDAIRAVEAIGLGNRRDFYWTLHAVFVNRRDQRELFDQAFHIFWRKPDLLERAMQLLLPQIETGEAAERGGARSPPRRCARPGKAAGSGRGRGGDAGRARRDPHLLAERGAAAQGLRADVGGRDRPGQGADPQHAAADPRGADPPLPAASRAAAGSICAARCASRCAAAAP